MLYKRPRKGYVSGSKDQRSKHGKSPIINTVVFGSEINNITEECPQTALHM